MSDFITKRNEDINQWYTDLVLKGELADYSDVRGCMVIKPYGYALWENMRDVLDKMIKDTGHVNAYFPLFVPKSLFEALATNEILQIVIFSILFGVALAAFSKKEAKPVIKLLDTVSHVVLKMVSYIMWTAPLGVLGAVASAIAKHGFEVFTLYAKYLGAFLVGIIILWLILLTVGYIILGKRLFVLLQRIKSPLLIAFSTIDSTVKTSFEFGPKL
jgi:Na+/H+-dicarboxylate symporter